MRKERPGLSRISDCPIVRFSDCPIIRLPEFPMSGKLTDRPESLRYALGGYTRNSYCEDRIFGTQRKDQDWAPSEHGTRNTDSSHFDQLNPIPKWIINKEPIPIWKLRSLSNLDS